MCYFETWKTQMTFEYPLINMFQKASLEYICIFWNWFEWDNEYIIRLLSNKETYYSKPQLTQEMNVIFSILV